MWRYQVRAYLNAGARAVDIYLARFNPTDRRSTFSPLMPVGDDWEPTEFRFGETENGYVERRTAALDDEESQQLMDDLWRCGLRPTEGQGSAGALLATQEHVRDLRTLLFHKEGISPRS